MGVGLADKDSCYFSETPCSCKSSDNEKLVFIIGPSSPEFEEDRKTTESVLRGVGLEPYFALTSLKEKGRYAFCEKICKKIKTSKFCVVLLNDPVNPKCNPIDLSSPVREPRPNVYYEYGLAVAMGKKVIPIARKGMEPPPFDVQQIDAIRYDTPDDLKSQLIEVCIATLTEFRQKGIQAEAEGIKTERRSDLQQKSLLFGLPVLFLILLIPARLIGFWFFGLSIFNIFDFLTIVSFGTFIMVFGFGAYLFEQRFIDPLLRIIKRVPPPYLIAYASYVALIAVVNLLVLLYPVSTRFYFEEIFANFLFNSAGYFALFFLFTFLAQFPIRQYFGFMEGNKLLESPKARADAFINALINHLKSTRSKRYLGAFLLPFILIAIFIPLDVSANLFTPSYTKSNETFTDSPHSPSNEILMYIYSNGTWVGGTVAGHPDFESDYRFYRLAKTEYTLNPPTFPLSSYLMIANPTNISFGTTEKANDNMWSDRTSQEIGAVYVSASENVVLRFYPESHNFSEIVYTVPSNVRQPLSANLTYWKHFTPSVLVSTSLHITDLGNHNYLENYTYTITNKEDVPITVRSLDFDRLAWQSANASTAKIYGNRTDVYAAYSRSEPMYIDENRTLDLMNRYVEKNSTLILSVTLQTSGF